MKTWLRSSLQDVSPESSESHGKVNWRHMLLEVLRVRLFTACTVPPWLECEILTLRHVQHVLVLTVWSHIRRSKQTNSGWWRNTWTFINKAVSHLGSNTLSFFSRWVPCVSAWRPQIRQSCLRLWLMTSDVGTAHRDVSVGENTLIMKR